MKKRGPGGWADGDRDVILFCNVVHKIGQEKGGVSRGYKSPPPSFLMLLESNISYSLPRKELLWKHFRMKILKCRIVCTKNVSEQFLLLSFLLFFPLVN